MQNELIKYISKFISIDGEEAKALLIRLYFEQWHLHHSTQSVSGAHKE